MGEDSSNLVAGCPAVISCSCHSSGGQLVKVIIATSVVISVARVLEESLSAKLIYEAVFEKLVQT